LNTLPDGHDEAPAWRRIGSVLCEHLQDTVLVTDRIGRIREVFGSFASTDGWQREQLVGKSVVRFLHPLDVATALARLSLNVADPSRSGQYRLEVRVLRADGRYRSAEVMISNRLADPEIRGLVLTARDIQPVRTAEIERQAIEDRFRTLTDLSENMVTMVSAEGHILYQSAAVREVLGYEAAERLGRSVMEFVHPEDSTRAAEAFRQRVTNADAVLPPTELRYLHRDGSTRWIQATSRNLLAHPAVAAIVVTTRDITARKTAELSLEKARALLDAALWAARVGLYSVDVPNDRMDISAQFFDVTGIDRVDWNAAPHPWASRLHPRDRETALKRYIGQIRGEHDEVESEYRLRSPRGWLWMLDRSRILERSADGRPKTVVGTLIDISALKALEQEIVDTISREQQRFSHELHDGLGQELTGISLLLRSIVTRMSRSVTADTVTADLNLTVSHLNDAIKNARALAHGLHPVAGDRGGLVGALQALVTNTPRLPDLQLVFDAQGWQNHPVPDNMANHAYRIAQEALGNAMRHAFASRIMICLAATPEWLELRIRDNGRGMDTTDESASGLGRRIMIYRAKMMGGSVAWRSAAGEGTEVTLRVSWHAMQNDPIVPVSRPAHPAGT
jgi:PAS domain S-box-containing protein